MIRQRVVIAIDIVAKDPRDLINRVLDTGVFQAEIEEHAEVEGEERVQVLNIGIVEG